MNSQFERCTQITRRRVGELVCGVFSILLSHPDGLPAKTVLERLARTVPPTKFENSTYPERPNVRRYERIVRFSTINAVKAGWMTKNRGLWTITDEGKKAYEKFTDPEEFAQQVGRLYRQWKQEQPEQEDVEVEAVLAKERHLMTKVSDEKMRPKILTRDPEILKEMEKLRLDARFGKNKHFSAADRKSRYNTLFGLPVVLINVLLGSVFFSQFLDVAYRDSIGPILAFAAAGLSTIQTFFSFHKAVEGHRSVGNRYIHVARECRVYMRGHSDGLVSTDELWQHLTSLLAEYVQINKDGETFPTSSGDYKQALMKKREELEAERAEQQPSRA